jgi:hypothetical protein
LERVEYKQREVVWHVDLGFGDWRDEFRFRPVVHVKDVVSGEMMPLNMRFITVRDETEDEFLLHLIYRSVLDLEVHEMREHFYVDGIKVHDPHKG